MSKLKEKLMLSEKGYSDLKKAITACTITNIALLLPSMVACLIFWELLKPFTGEAISWAALWKLLGLGLWRLYGRTAPVKGWSVFSL